MDEANRYRHDKASRELIKGAKWLLLGNWKNLPDRAAKVRLNELLDANQPLMTAYVLKDAFLKELWRYMREGWARKAWENWMKLATEPVRNFVCEPFLREHGAWRLQTKS